MWQKLSIILITVTFIDRSFETCTPVTSYETECKNEKLVKGHPLRAPESTRVLRFQSKAEVVPAGVFERLPNLESLELKSIGLAKIEPGAFEKLENLDELLLNGNQLTMLENKAFDGCPNLKTLDLNHNKIKQIDDAFAESQSLEVLNLSFNQLGGIPKALKSLTALEELYLKKNNIGKIETNAFSGLSGLVELDLTNNKLEDLDVNNIASNLPNLKTIHLDGNNFKCSKLKAIVDGFKNRNINVAKGKSKSSTAVNGIDCKN